MKRGNITPILKKASATIEFMNTVPFPKGLIDSLVRIGHYTREELEEKNRRLYAERGWEKYLL